MNEEKKNTDNGLPNIKWVSIGLFWLILTVSIVLALNYSDVQEVKVPVPCVIVENEALVLPDNVITKGFDVFQNEDGEVIGKECYFIKEAGLLEKKWYGWVNFK